MESKDARPSFGPEWITPREALEIVRNAVGDHAQTVIMDRLRGNLLQAVAGRLSMIHGDNDPELREKMPIPPHLWQEIQNPSHMWDAGQARFYSRNSVYESRTVICTDIRFLKKQIAEMFPAAESPVAHGSDQDPANEIQQSGPLVSEHALRAWFDAFKAAYSGTAQDTEEMAMRSAAGCFPGKSVVRNKVRALRGPQKRGPRRRGDSI